MISKKDYVHKLEKVKLVIGNGFDLDENTKYLNELLRVGINSPYNGPKTLFRYREFNDYNIDSLLKDYVFLCPAEKLDDETECVVTTDTSQIGNLDTGCIKKTFVWRVVEMIKPYCDDAVYNDVVRILSGLMYGNGDIKRNFLIDDAYKIQEMAPEIDHVLLVNILANITDIPEKPEESNRIKKLISNGIFARKTIGVCSLSLSPDIEKMWERYAGSDSGYCIEYDLSNYDNHNIFPVIYNDEREMNVIEVIASDYIGQMITYFSGGRIMGDISSYFRLFLSKYSEWEYQKEWRILGDAGDKIKAPPIKRIILGKNITAENEKLIVEYCSLKGIPYTKR